MILLITNSSKCAKITNNLVLKSPSFANLTIFKDLIARYGYAENNRGPFKLTIVDLGAHNLLVNRQFKIIGVTGFDRLMAAPIELVAQFPIFTGLERMP